MKTSEKNLFCLAIGLIVDDTGKKNYIRYHVTGKNPEQCEKTIDSMISSDSFKMYALHDEIISIHYFETLEDENKYCLDMFG